jgi:hypothetical protein
MKIKIAKIQTARVLTAFLRYADDKGQLDKGQEQFFHEISGVFPNGNVLEAHLYELSQQGIIHYEEIGEDGFTPIILASCTPQTASHLDRLLLMIDSELNDLTKRLSDILTFDPDRLKSEIVTAEAQLADARKNAETNEMLKPLLRQIGTIEKHFLGVAAVAEKYEEVYKNIIRPVQLEGQSGVKATVRWAIYGIVASTLSSIVIGNWSAIVAIFKDGS